MSAFPIMLLIGVTIPLVSLGLSAIFSSLEGVLDMLGVGGDAGGTGQLGDIGDTGGIGDVGDIGGIGQFGDIGGFGDVSGAGGMGDIGGFGDVSGAGGMGDIGGFGDVSGVGGFGDIGGLGDISSPGGFGDVGSLGDISGAGGFGGAGGGVGGTGGGIGGAGGGVGDFGDISPAGGIGGAGGGIGGTVGDISPAGGISGGVVPVGSAVVGDAGHIAGSADTQLSTSVGKASVNISFFPASPIVWCSQLIVTGGIGTALENAGGLAGWTIWAISLLSGYATLLTIQNCLLLPLGRARNHAMPKTVLIGKIVKVNEAILKDGVGAVQATVNGNMILYAAKTLDGSPISQGKFARVIQYTDHKAIVEEVWEDD